MHSEKPLILFQTEGAYPYSGGGISTWAKNLCNELKGDVDFILFALTGEPYMEQKYNMSTNIRSVIHVPLWGIEEPAGYFDTQTPFSSHVERKYRTNPDIIKKIFLPMFRDFIDRLFDPFRPAKEFGELIYGFWRYYQHFDYKETLASPLVWREFKKLLHHEFDGRVEKLPNFSASMLDVTFAQRWLYHFMMPLAVPLPKVSATHSTLAGFPAIISIAAKFEYGTPMILTDHGVFIRERLINVSRADMPYFSKWLLVNLATFITRAVYHFADLISPVTTVNSKWEMRFEASEDRIRPIYNGVNTNEFYPQSKPDHTQGVPTVVAVAHVFPLKDIETMIRSCEFVRREIPDVQFLLYGNLDVDKSYTEQCKDLVYTLNLGNNFSFEGYHDDPSMIFNEGDISILSSISEGFPYTVIESMSCGRPVVATDVGGIREAVEGCGILCKPRDAKSLADGVIKLLRDDDLRNKFAKKGRQRVLDRYTITQTVDSYKQIYRDFHERDQRPLSHSIQINSVKKTLKEL